MSDYHTPSDQWPTFAAWCSEQHCFARFDRDDTAVDAMIVVPYTFCPNVADILDESNHAAILEILKEADPSGDDYVIRKHGHWATPYEMVLVKPGSEAFKAMDRTIAALADYPVLNEEDFSERECAAQYESVTDELGRLDLQQANGEPLTDEQQGDLASEICSGASSSELMDRDDVKSALEDLGWSVDDDDVWTAGPGIPAGETVNVRAHASLPGMGLSYDAFTGALVEPKETDGWDVIEVQAGDTVVSVYSFDVERA
jgi:hypothetical protein